MHLLFQSYPKIWIRSNHFCSHIRSFPSILDKYYSYHNCTDNLYLISAIFVTLTFCLFTYIWILVNKITVSIIEYQIFSESEILISSLNTIPNQTSACRHNVCIFWYSKNACSIVSGVLLHRGHFRLSTIFIRYKSSFVKNLLCNTSNFNS